MEEWKKIFFKELERQVRYECEKDSLMGISMGSCHLEVRKAGYDNPNEVLHWRNRDRKKIIRFINKIGKEYGMKYNGTHMV